MSEELSKGRRVLFTAIVIACVLVILKSLYNLGYFGYTMTEAYMTEAYADEHTFGYALFTDRVTGLLSSIFSYAGLVAVFAFWKAPKPKWQFILLIVSLFLPKIVSGILSFIFRNAVYVENNALVYSIISSAVILCCMALSWVMIIILFRKSGKDAKSIFIAYMVNLAFVHIMTMLTLYPVPAVFTAYSSIFRIIAIGLSVMTIVYLKKKLQDNMPFTNTIRWIKKECTNKPPED